MSTPSPATKVVVMSVTPAKNMQFTTELLSAETPSVGGNVRVLMLRDGLCEPVIELDGTGQCPPFFYERKPGLKAARITVALGDTDHAYLKTISHQFEALVRSKEQQWGLTPGEYTVEPLVKDRAPRNGGAEGETWPSNFTCQAAMQSPDSTDFEDPRVRVIDAKRQPVNLPELAGGRWSKLRVMLKCIYITTSEEWGTKVALSKKLMYIRVAPPATYNTAEEIGIEPKLATTAVPTTLCRDFDLAQVPLGAMVNKKLFNLVDFETQHVELVHGGHLPFDVDLGQSGKLQLALSVGDMQEDASFRSMTKFLQEQAVARKDAWGLNGADEAVAAMVSAVIGDKKAKSDGVGHFPALLTAGIDENYNPFVDSQTLQPVPMADVKGRRWTSAVLQMRCIFLQKKAVGITKRWKKILLEEPMTFVMPISDDDEDEAREVMIDIMSMPMGKRQKLA